MDANLVYCIPLSRPARGTLTQEYNILQYTPGKSLQNRRIDTY